jgi:dienelactone hydrolase
MSNKLLDKVADNYAEEGYVVFVPDLASASRPMSSSASAWRQANGPG